MERGALNEIDDIDVITLEASKEREEEEEQAIVLAQWREVKESTFFILGAPFKVGYVA